MCASFDFFLLLNEIFCRFIVRMYTADEIQYNIQLVVTIFPNFRAYFEVNVLAKRANGGQWRTILVS